MAANIGKISTIKQPIVVSNAIFFNEISIAVPATNGKHYLFIYTASPIAPNSGWSNGNYTVNGGTVAQLVRQQDANSNSYYIGRIILYVVATSNSIYFYKKFSDSSDSRAKGNGCFVALQLD